MCDSGPSSVMSEGPLIRDCCHNHYKNGEQVAEFPSLLCVGKNHKKCNVKKR